MRLSNGFKFLIPCFVFIWGCSSPSKAHLNQIIETENPIIGGEPDTSHDAVVYIQMSNGSYYYGCSGTIIEKSDSRAYILTAGHCILDDSYEIVAAQAENVDDVVDAIFPVIRRERHSDYIVKDDGSVLFDFGLLEVLYASENTPVIPALSPELDDVQAGSVGTFVGFGMIQDGSDAGTEPDPNSTRNEATGEVFIRHVEENYAFLEFDQGDGISYQNGDTGTCNGDSGGPWLFEVNGTEYVAAITSYGDENCVDTGFSGINSQVQDDFIEPFINKTKETAVSCEECSEAAMNSYGVCGKAIDLNECLSKTCGDCALTVDSGEGGSENGGGSTVVESGPSQDQSDLKDPGSSCSFSTQRNDKNKSNLLALFFLFIGHLRKMRRP